LYAHMKNKKKKEFLDVIMKALVTKEKKTDQSR
jgi:hypothetical protein